MGVNIKKENSMDVRIPSLVVLCLAPYWIFTSNGDSPQPINMSSIINKGYIVRKQGLNFRNILPTFTRFLD